MTIIVTGGAGYIGSHMVLRLLNEHENVIVIDDLSTGFRSLIPAGVKFVHGSISDRRFLAEIFASEKIEAVFHFAAKVIVPESVKDPLIYYRNNTTNVIYLLEECIKHSVKRFIFSSTAAVYGAPEISPVSEYTSLNPISPYGWSKMMSERIITDAANAHGIQFAILRYFNVAGADPQRRSGQSTKAATHLIKVAVEAALGKRSHLEVFGTDYETRDGTCIRDYVQVSDLCDAHFLSLQYLRNGGKNDLFNVGYQRGYSVLDVIEEVKAKIGNFPVTLSSRRLGDPPVIIASNLKIRQTLGWSPKFNNLGHIVEQAAEWERLICRS